jgi:hypothetical protein
MLTPSDLTLMVKTSPAHKIVYCNAANWARKTDPRGEFLKTRVGSNFTPRRQLWLGVNCG